MVSEITTVRALECKFGQLERELRELRELNGGPTEEEELEARLAREAERPAPETAASSFVRMEVERHKRADEEWLALCGVPADSDASLRETVLALRGFYNEHAFKAFLRLATAIAGRACDDPTYKQLVDAWPKIKPEVQTALAAMAWQYANKPTEM